MMCWSVSRFIQVVAGQALNVFNTPTKARVRNTTSVEVTFEF